MSYVTVHPQPRLFLPHLNVWFFLHVTGIQFYKYALGTHQFQWRHHILSSPFTDNQPTVKAAHNLKQHHSEVKNYSMKVRKCSFNPGSQVPSRWQIEAEAEAIAWKSWRFQKDLQKGSLSPHNGRQKRKNLSPIYQISPAIWPPLSPVSQTGEKIT